MQRKIQGSNLGHFSLQREGAGNHHPHFQLKERDLSLGFNAGFHHHVTEAATDRHTLVAAAAASSSTSEAAVAGGSAHWDPAANLGFGYPTGLFEGSNSALPLTSSSTAAALGIVAPAGMGFGAGGSNGLALLGGASAIQRFVVGRAVLPPAPTHQYKGVEPSREDLLLPFYGDRLALRSGEEDVSRRWGSILASYEMRGNAGGNRVEETTPLFMRLPPSSPIGTAAPLRQIRSNSGEEGCDDGENQREGDQRHAVMRRATNSLDPASLANNMSSVGNSQDQEQQQQQYFNRRDIPRRESSLKQRRGSGCIACQDCGNKAKKDCSHLRCRSCCKSRGFDCATHLRSTWVPAAKRREKQVAQMEAAASGQAIPRSKRARMLAVALQQQPSCSINTSTSTGTPSDLNSPHRCPQYRLAAPSVSQENAGMVKGMVPAEVRAQAVFKCLRVTAVDDGQKEYAYQATVDIGGRTYKGVLYDQGPASPPSSSAHLDHPTPALPYSDSAHLGAMH